GGLMTTAREKSLSDDRLGSRLPQTLTRTRAHNSRPHRGRTPPPTHARAHGRPGSIDHGVVSVPSVTVQGIGGRAEQAMARHVAEFEVVGPWSLAISRRFWEGFTPAALAGEPAGPGLRTAFCAEGDWRRAEAEVTQAGDTARVVLTGDGDLDAAAAQARRVLALDGGGGGWPDRGRPDPGLAGPPARPPRP